MTVVDFSTVHYYSFAYCSILHVIFKFHLGFFLESPVVCTINMMNIDRAFKLFALKLVFVV